MRGRTSYWSNYEICDRGNYEYVRLVVCEKKNPAAERYSAEAKPHMIKMEKVVLMSTSLPKQLGIIA